MIPEILPNGERFLTWKYRNLLWWETEGRITDNPEVRRLYWKNFLDYNKINPDNIVGRSIGEVCCGPYGGMLKEFFKPSLNRLVYTDVFMGDFLKMNYVDFVGDIIQCDTEDMSALKDNFLDILIGYNCLDHGWDIKKSLTECFRISKECFLSFDCRAVGPSEEYKLKPNDKFHFQRINFFDIKEFVENYSKEKGFFVDVTRYPHSSKLYPIINIHLKK